MLKRKSQSYSDDFDIIAKKLEIVVTNLSNNANNDENYNSILNDINKMLAKIREFKIPLDKDHNISSLCETIIKIQNLHNKTITDDANILLTLEVLASIQNLKYTEYQTNLTPFFLKCLNFANDEKLENQKLIQQKFSDFFLPLFQNNLFSFNFFNDSIYQDFFTQFLPHCDKSNDFCKSTISLIINKPNSHSFQIANLNNALQIILTSYKPNTDYDELQLYFVETLFRRISKLEHLNNSSSANNLPSIIDRYSDSKEKWITFFSTLLYSQSESSTKSQNQEIYKFLLNLCQNHPEKQSSVFHIFRSYKHYQEVQVNFPLVHFFKDFQQPIQDLLDFLTEIVVNSDPMSSFMHEVFPKLLQKTFRIFSVQMIDNPDQYNQLIQIIQNSKVNFDENPSRFLTCFLRTPSSSTLNLIFEDQSFVDLSIHYFSLPISKEIQPLIFRSVLELCEKAIIVVQFLKSSVTKANILCLMDFIISNPTDKSFLILLSAFHDGSDVAEKFIACDGLIFLEKCFNDKVMPIEYYSFIISSLVMDKPFPEIDEFILNLNKDHPLFSISQKHLENIVYGKNGGKFRPIRVPSLFHLLQNKTYLDPYNSYTIGKFGLQSYLENGIDIYDIPFINEVANRYLSSNHIDLMMKNPKNFDKFCDTENYDHFSLFVLYPMQKDLIFKGNFNAVSFWVKFESLPEIKNEQFFYDENAHLYINANRIICEIYINPELNNKSGNVKRFETEINTRWIHFFIITEKTWKSTTKTVFINGELKFQSNLQSLPKDKNHIFVFCNYEQHLMYIGSAIRFFTKELKGSNDPFALEIFKQKPQFISKLPDVQEMVITPFNITKKHMEKMQISIPPNCYIVPYFGFPFHFISKRRLSDLFIALRNSQDEASFTSVFDALLSINLIIDIDQDQFFRHLLNSMILCKQFLSKKLLSNALRSISKQHPSGIILLSIFFEPNMFEKDDLSLFLEIFLDTFKESDFSKSHEFELILLATIHKHPECTSVLMDNIDQFPKLHELLVDTLKYQKKSNDLQLRIVDGYSQIVQSSTSESNHHLFKQVSPCLITPSKSLSAQIFRLMTTISINTNKPFPLSNSIVYSIMKLVEFEAVWICVSELNRNFKNQYISLLLGLVWSRSFGTLFLLSFYDKSVDLFTNHYHNGIQYLIANAADIVEDSYCHFIITNLFPILSNLTHFETTKCLDSQSLLDFTQSVLESFHATRPEYYIFKPLVTKQFFSITSLVSLYSSILRKCKSLSKFNQFYFALFVGAPFFDVSLNSEYLPIMNIQFLKHYEPFQFESRFFSLLLYPLANNLFFYDSIDIIIDKIFLICESDTKLIETCNLLLFSIFTSNRNDEKHQNELELKIYSNISLFYKISQKYQLAWFSILSKNKKILNELLKFELGPQERKILIQLIHDEQVDLKNEFALLNSHYNNSVRMVSKEFINDNKSYLNNQTNFFNDIDKSISMFKENSQSIRQRYRKQKFLFQENMIWSNLLSFLSDQMSDISLFRSNMLYLHPKCMPYQCPRRIAHSIFTTKDEILDLFENHTTQLNDNINARIFLRSESSLYDNPMIVDCRLCRYLDEIPSVMFVYKTCFLFLTYAELYSQDEIRFLDNNDYKFIESVFLGHWGPTTIFSSHIVIRTMFDQVISIQFSKKKQFNLWTFRQGSFTVKMDVKKLIQVQYAISSAAIQGHEKLSPYPFLFNIDNYPTAFEKWSKYEISTDELLLIANGIGRRNFHSLKKYPYFPFIFSRSNYVLPHNQFKPKYLVSKAPSAPLAFSSDASETNIQSQDDVYSIPIKGKETAAFLRIFLPFSYFINNQQNQQTQNSLPSMQQETNRITVKPPTVISPKSSFKQTTDSILLNTDSDDSSSEINLKSINSSSKTTESLLQTNEQEDEIPRTTSLVLDHENIIGNMLSDEDGKKPKNVAIQHRVSFNPQNMVESPERNTENKSNVESNKKGSAYISFSSMSSSFLSPFSNQLPKTRYSFTPTTKISPIIESTLDRIDTIIKEFALNETKNNASYRLKLSKCVCPANFFYTPELINKFVDNPIICIQNHRKDLEDPKNSEFIIEWIMNYCFYFNMEYAPNSKKLLTDRQVNYVPFPSVFSLNITHFNQFLKKSCKPSKRFMFTNDNKLKRIKRLSARVIDSYFALIDKKLLSLSIIDFTSNQKKKSHVICSITNDFFAFSKSISVSENGLFISVDFEFGVTHAYRIYYSKSIPQSIVFLSDFSCNMLPLSVIDGFNWLCCTAIQYQLVMWDIFDGYIHNVVNFNDNARITSISLDKDVGIWVATEKNIYYVSINGQILSSCEIIEQISEIEAVPIPSSKIERAAVCGTVSGKVYIITPRFDTKTIDSKELKGKHTHEIKQIVINKHLKMFITVDAKNRAVVWTAFGIKSDPLNVAMFDVCALCHRKPKVHCVSCNRAICKKCIINGMCKTCYSMNIF